MPGIVTIKVLGVDIGRIVATRGSEAVTDRNLGPA
jgi:hypothetical protein